MKTLVWMIAEDCRLVRKSDDTRVIELHDDEPDALGMPVWKRNTSWTPGAVSTLDGCVLMGLAEYIISNVPPAEENKSNG